MAEEAKQREQAMAHDAQGARQYRANGRSLIDVLFLIGGLSDCHIGFPSLEERARSSQGQQATFVILCECADPDCRA